MTWICSSGSLLELIFPILASERPVELGVGPFLVFAHSVLLPQGSSSFSQMPSTCRWLPKVYLQSRADLSCAMQTHIHLPPHIPIRLLLGVSTDIYRVSSLFPALFLSRSSLSCATNCKHLQPVDCSSRSL